MVNRVDERELRRLSALRDYDVLDSAPETAFDDLTRLAATICGTPIALVSLVDERRQWFKSRVGLQAPETPRDIAFCTHAIQEARPMFVEDATKDLRFRDNPLVTGDPMIKFYGGAPLVTPEGQLGTLCVIDRVPRRLNADQTLALEVLSRQVVHLLQLRRSAARLAKALEEVKVLAEFLPMCAWCRKVRDDDGYWQQIEGYLKAKVDVQTSHGICQECRKKHFGSHG